MASGIARIKGIVLAGLAVFGPVSTATAQDTVRPDETYDRGNNQGVRDREQPEFESVGIPLGGFRLYPRAGAEVEWNDNVYAEDEANDPDEDLAYTMSVGARLASQWGRHSLSFEGAIADTEYQDLDENIDPFWNLGGEARLEIKEGTDAVVRANFIDTYEQRGVNDFTDTADPIHYDELDGMARLSHRLNRIVVTGEVDYSKVDFDDGFDFRDRTAVELIARADWSYSPTTSFFVEGAQRWNDFEVESVDPRDYERSRWLIGSAFDITNLVRGEIGLGYSWVSYDNPTAPDFDGYAARASVDWFITRLTTLNVAASRDVADAGDPSAASRLVTSAGVRVDHELLRNVILWGRAGWAEEEYQGDVLGLAVFDRTDEIVSGSFGCDWLVNRWASVRARYTRTERTSEGVNRFRDYEQNRAVLGITLRR
ncbi:MAG: outer membrane beta-barrel protein [Hyphomonadaceae bacterium]